MVFETIALSIALVKCLAATSKTVIQTRIGLLKDTKFDHDGRSATTAHMVDRQWSDSDHTCVEETFLLGRLFVRRVHLTLDRRVDIGGASE